MGVLTTKVKIKVKAIYDELIMLDVRKAVVWEDEGYRKTLYSDTKELQLWEGEIVEV